MSSDESPSSLPQKLSLVGWLEQFLPFKLPRIPLPQTARNLDKAVARLVLAGGEYLASRLDASTSRVVARSDAERAFIGRATQRMQSDADIPHLEDRAMEYALGDAVHRQHNRELILSLTAEHLAQSTEPEDAPQEIGDDWLNLFARLAEEKSDEDIQHLWSRILSAEIRSPGSSSLRTLQFLSTISRDDAIRIVKAFSYVLDELFILGNISEDYLSYDELLFLLEMGVISEIGTHHQGPDYEKHSKSSSKYLSQLVYFDKVILLEGGDPEYVVKIPACPLSTAGKEIFRISDTKRPDYRFLDYCISTLSSEKLGQIYTADVVRRTGGVISIRNKSLAWRNAS